MSVYIIEEWAVVEREPVELAQQTTTPHGIGPKYFRDDRAVCVWRGSRREILRTYETRADAERELQTIYRKSADEWVFDTRAEAESHLANLIEQVELDEAD